MFHFSYKSRSPAGILIKFGGLFVNSGIPVSDYIDAWLNATGDFLGSISAIFWRPVLQDR